MLFSCNFFPGVSLVYSCICDLVVMCGYVVVTHRLVRDDSCGYVVCDGGDSCVARWLGEEVQVLD